jgi:molecular chaperone GrpE
MSTTDGSVWPDEPVPAGVQPAPGAGAEDEQAALRTEIDDANDRMRRIAAELDNARKRHARQSEELQSAARAKAASAWLPVIDNLERAVRTAPEACESGAFVAGLEALRDQAISVMESLGFHRHAEVGVPFDPYLHEAVDVRDDVDAPPGTVVDVVRAGYGEGERQLRPAGVVVAGQRG